MIKLIHFLLLAVFFSGQKYVYGMDNTDEEKKGVYKNQKNIEHSVFENSDSVLEKEQLKDPRTKIQNPWEWPWTVHGYLRMEWKRERVYFGSGILISKHCVLTAASNLWGYAKELNRPEKISFFIGVKDGEPYEVNMNNDDEKENFIVEFKSKKMAINSKFINLSEKNSEEAWGQNFAVVYLEEALGEKIGYAAFGPRRDIEPGFSIRISGYPGFLQQEVSLYTMEGKLTKREKEYIQYDVGTSRGQGGSGVCVKEEDLTAPPFCFAIHTYGPHKDGNIGTLITKEKFDVIKQWINFFEGKNKSSTPQPEGIFTL